MYDSLIRNYLVLFEGAFAPVFYKSFYPTGIEGGNQEHWDLFSYARGLKRDKPSDDERFAVHEQEYEQDLRDFLECFVEDTSGLTRGAVVMPSSTAGKVNRVTELVRRVVGSEYASTISDLTRHFLRTKNKEKSHSGGTRSVIENMDTLSVDPGARVQGYGAILVLDDITTSGNSFLAADAKLSEAGFRGQLVNFAFARTCPSEGVDLFRKWEERGRLTDGTATSATRSPAAASTGPGEGAAGYRVSFADGSHREFDSLDDFKGRVRRITRLREIEGVVFDLDDTLVCDTPRDIGYEEYLRGDDGQDGQENMAAPCPYMPFPGVRDFMSLGMPFAIVSNRRKKALMRIVGDPVVNDSLFPGRMERERQALEEWRLSGSRSYPLELLRGEGTKPNQHENLFSYPSKRVDGYDKPFGLYKPCPEGVLQAIQHIRSASGLEADARIVGVGNTLEDMIAYKEAGIESVLALWGVPDYLREHAERHWGADHCFGSMAEFGRWCGREAPRIDDDIEGDVEDLFSWTTPAQPAPHRQQDGESSILRRVFTGYRVFFDRRLLPEGVIHWREAEGHIGETVSIYGEVESTYFDWEDYERNIAAYQMGADPGPTFIEVGERYPSKRLVKIVIWGRDRGKFREPPDSCFMDKAVIFTGTPYVFNGITTVQISDPESIHVVSPIDGYVHDDSEGEDQNSAYEIVIDDGYIDDDDDEGHDHAHDHDDVDYEPDPADFPLYGWHFDEDNGWLDFYPEE